MPRKPRLQGKGMIHHVVARGNNQQDIFTTDGERIRYLQLIERYRDRYRFTVLSYCLMHNHVHLLLRQDRAPLSVIMQGIQQSYTQFFNRKHQRTGHVFQQRFASFPCMEDAYLIALIAYIHNNPMKAGLCASADDYRWSSHREIIRPKDDDLIDLQALLRLSGVSRAQFLREYRAMLGEVDASDVEDLYIQNDDRDAQYAVQVTAERKEERQSRPHTISDIRDAIEQYRQEDSIDITEVEYRRIFSILCSRNTPAQAKEIAEALAIRPARVSQIRKEFAQDAWPSGLRRTLAAIERRFLDIGDDFVR